jgi:hypothetical protein
MTKLNQSHLESNHKNGKYGHLGGAAYAKKAAELTAIKISNYNTNPKLCKYCKTIIPYNKQKNNFCNSSCSCTYNNLHRDKSVTEKVKNTWYKKNKPISENRKSGRIKQFKYQIEPNAPYSKLYRCTCSHCKTKFQNRTQKKYCSDCEYLYSHNNRAKYWFTFNVFQYPELFDLSLIAKYGFRDNKINPNGITRDHKISINEAIKNNYDPYYIKHPMNCELMLFNDNNKKKTNSSISYQELIRLVREFDT